MIQGQVLLIAKTRVLQRKMNVSLLKKATTKSRDDTLDSTENCSDIDRLHKHVTELQNIMAKEKVVGKILSRN